MWPREPHKGLPQAHDSREDNPHRPGQQEQRTCKLGPSGTISGGTLYSALLHEEHTQGIPLKLRRDNLASGVLKQTRRGSGM